MASVIAYNPTEFHKVSNKTKEQLVEESEKDVEQYEDRVDHSIKENDTEIKEADNWFLLLLLPNKFKYQEALKVQISGLSSNHSKIWPLFTWNR